MKDNLPKFPEFKIGQPDIKSFDSISVKDMNNNFAYDKEKWGKVREEIEKYGIKNTKLNASVPNTWFLEDIDTSKYDEMYNNMSEAERGFLKNMMEIEHIMETGRMPAREDTELRRLYYSRIVKDK